MSSKSKVHFWKTRNVLKSHHQLHLIGIDSAMAMDSEVKDVDFFEANWNNNNLDNPTLSQICEIWSHENLAFKGELSLNYNEDGYGDFGVGMDTGQTRNATWRRIYAFDDTGNRKPETSCVLSGEFKHKNITKWADMFSKYRERTGQNIFLHFTSWIHKQWPTD